MEQQIGDRIAEERKKLNMTQNELAEKLMVSNKAISKWESNGGNPSIEFLPKLADLFGCTIDYLVRGDQNTKQILKYELPICLGKDKEGQEVWESITNIAPLSIESDGFTILNGFMMGIVDKLLNLEDVNVKFGLIGRGFNNYRHLESLFSPVAHNNKTAIHLIDLCTIELKNRYEMLEDEKFSSFEKYKECKNLPYIVLMIDDFYDVSNGKDDLTEKLQYLCQLGRGVGIYVIVGNCNNKAIPGIISVNTINTIYFLNKGKNPYGHFDMKIKYNQQDEDNKENAGINLNSIDFDGISSLKNILKLRNIKYSDEMNYIDLYELLQKDNKQFLSEDIDEFINFGFVTIATIQRYLSIGYAMASRLMDLLREKNHLEKQKDDYCDIIKPELKEIVKGEVYKFLATNI